MCIYKWRGKREALIYIYGKPFLSWGPIYNSTPHNLLAFILSLLLDSVIITKLSNFYYTRVKDSNCPKEKEKESSYEVITTAMLYTKHLFYGCLHLFLFFTFMNTIK